MCARSSLRKRPSRYKASSAPQPFLFRSNIRNDLLYLFVCLWHTQPLLLAVSCSILKCWFPIGAFLLKSLLCVFSSLSGDFTQRPCWSAITQYSVCWPFFPPPIWLLQVRLFFIAQTGLEGHQLRYLFTILGQPSVNLSPASAAQMAQPLLRLQSMLLHLPKTPLRHFQACDPAMGEGEEENGGSANFPGCRSEGD